MKPMLLVSKLDLNFRLFLTSTKKLCQSEGSIKIVTNHNLEPTWTECTRKRTLALKIHMKLCSFSIQLG